MKDQNFSRALARSVAESITITTPGGVTWHKIRRRKSAPILVALAWVVVLIPVVLGAFALVTR